MKIQKHDFAKTIHVCPNGCHAALSTTAHVMQDWKVDLEGNFIEVLDDALEMVCLPDDDNIWTCLKCGEEAELYMARGFHMMRCATFRRTESLCFCQTVRKYVPSCTTDTKTNRLSSVGST